MERKWDKYRNKPLYGYFWQNGSRQSPLMKGQSKSLKQWSHCYLWKLVHFQVSQWGGKETFQRLCCTIWYLRISPEKPMIWWKMWECERIDVCRHPNRGLEIVHSIKQPACYPVVLKTLGTVEKIIEEFQNILYSPSIVILSRCGFKIILPGNIKI